jgi:prepilin-type processing-associated H-X9-DG protein
VQLLPFIEQRSTYNHLNFSLGMYDDANSTVRMVPIRILLCPSDFTTQAGGGIAMPSSIAGNHHHTEAPIDTTNTGVLFLNSHVRTEDIEDGASNTIALGEKRCSWGSGLGWASGTNATLRNGGTAINGVVGAKTAALPDPVGGFSSLHPGGANFCFADGSVRFLKASANTAFFQKLMHRHDGELVIESY